MGAPQPSKRQKSTDTGGGQPPNGNYANGPPFNQQPFQPGPYNGPPPGGQQQFQMQPQFSNNSMWQPGPGQQQPYGNNNVPWQNGQQQGMFRQSPPLGPPNGGPMTANNWSSGGSGGGYRGPPPPNQSPPPPQQGRRGGKQGSQKSKSTKKSSSNAANGPPQGPQGGSYQGGWQQQQQAQQWPQNQWGGGGPPPQMWQQGPGNGPPRHPPQPSPPPGPLQGQPMVPVNQNAWTGGSQPSSPPPRQSKKGRPRASPDPLMGFPQGGLIAGLPPIGMDTGPIGDIFVMSAGVGTGPDDDGSRKPSGGSSVASREKGRGSYRCGRCGAPKKGHVCPYQPKLKRRPDEPPPETRNAAIQVEMDEFMTLRRLNLEIQGFPESYATASHMIESRVIGEPHPYALGDGGVMTVMGFTLGTQPMPGMGTNVPGMGTNVAEPMHVASQPTPMEAESGGAPQEKEHAPTQTAEQKENTTTSEVPAEELKTAST